MAIRTCARCGTKNRVDEQAAVVSQPVCGKCGAKLPDATATTSANGKPQVVTDATFASDVLTASASVPVLGFGAGVGGLLGAMVYSVPSDRARPRSTGGRVGGTL